LACNPSKTSQLLSKIPKHCRNKRFYYPSLALSFDSSQCRCVEIAALEDAFKVRFMDPSAEEKLVESLQSKARGTRSHSHRLGAGVPQWKMQRG
jgi:hypothetical protein